MGESVHAAPDFWIEVVVVDEGSQVAVVETGLRDVFDIDALVIVVFLGGGGAVVQNFYCSTS